MRNLVRWTVALTLVVLAAWVFPWFLAFVALYGALWVVADRVTEWQKDTAAFDADAIAELKAQSEETAAIRRMFRGTRLTQTREKL